MAAAHLRNPDTKLQFAARKRAPGASWKKLRVPPQGGDPDRFRCFLWGKTDPDSLDVKAIARAALALLRSIEKRSAVAAQKKRKSPKWVARENE